MQSEKKSSLEKQRRSAGADAPSGTDWRAWIRRGGLLVFLVVASWLWFNGDFDVCTTVGGIEQCEPAPLASPPSAAAAVIVIVLLLPDVSEISFFQLLSLKRIVASQEARLDAQQASLQSIATSVAMTSAKAESNLQFFLNTDRAEAAEAARRLSVTTGTGLRETTEEYSSPEQLRMELISLNERITRGMAELLEEKRPLPDRWTIDDVGNIAWIVRRARNSVAHDVLIDDESVWNAVRTGRALVEVLGLDD